MTFDLNDQIVALSRQTSSMLKQIHDLGTQGSLDKLQATMHSVSQSAADLARLQTEQIETGREVLEAFHNFKPEQLLPKWLREFSASIVDLAFLLKTEGPLAIVFAAPTFCLSMFGRFRLASCMLAAYCEYEKLLMLANTDHRQSFLDACGRSHWLGWRY